MAKVQFIAYQLKTAAERDPKSPSYPGLANHARDLELRCKIMMDAIENAASSPHVKSNSLKIFVAPEFFFRGGRDGAYDLELISGINGYFDQFLASPKYKNWIFFLGTAIGGIGLGGGEAEIFNICLIRKGGIRIARTLGAGESLADGEKDSLLIYKEFVSAIDFFGAYFGDKRFMTGPQAGQANLAQRQVKLQATAGSRDDMGQGKAISPNIHGQTRIIRPSLTKQQIIETQYLQNRISKAVRDAQMQGQAYTISEDSATGLGGGSVFDMHGHRFVVEICLDHAQRRAQEINVKEPTFHIITSCGMTPVYTMVREGGFFFLVDGIEDNPMTRVHMLRVIGRRLVKLKATPVMIEMSDSDNWKYHLSDATNLFEGGRGWVVVYPPQNMPAPNVTR